MAKRYQPLKEFGGSMKKPKLDVSVNKGRSGASTSKAASDVHIRPTQKEPFKPVADLWDDDEDDVLLLATQVAESEIAATKTRKDELPMEITDSEITFSDFEPKIVQHSTQQTRPNDFFSQMFDDDDDDIATLAAAIEKDAKKQTKGSGPHFRKESDEWLFKKPALPQGHFDDEPGPSTRQVAIPLSQTTDKRAAAKEQSPLTTGPSTSKGCISVDVSGPSSVQDTVPLPQTADTSAAARKQLASERQIKFLMERLDALKRENVELSKDLSNVKETMQTKTGEASMLRDELRHTKQKLDELKMEKVFQTESINAESRNKIEELSKKVQDKESELQLKSMECSMLKIRQADDTKRFDTTTREATNPISDNWNENELFPTDFDDTGYMKQPTRVETVSIMLTEEVYESYKVKVGPSKLNSLIHRELDNLQRILAKIFLNSNDITDELLMEVTESVQKVFSAFHTYVERLDFGFHQTVLPSHEYNVLEDTSTRKTGCFHLSAPLCNGERAINMRRYIAVLAVICERSANLVHILLTHNFENKPLLQLAIDAIMKLGFSIEICPHFGVLEAFAVLLRSLLLHIHPDKNGDNPYLELIFNFLKNLVFARPSPWTLYELSYSIIDICDRFPRVFSLFCVNSKRDTYVLDRAKSVYRFSNETCLLQVYCGLVGAAFPLYNCLSESIFELQAKLCLNYVRFVFYCATEPPDFIEKILSVDEEDDESDDENFWEWMNKETNANMGPFGTFRDEQPSTSKKAAAKDEQPTTSKNAELRDEQANKKSKNAELRDEKPTTSKDTAFKDEQPTTSKNAALRDEQPTTSKDIAFKDEQPTTSKKAALKNEQEIASKNVTASSTRESSASDIMDNTTKEDTKTDRQCKCFEELCLTAVKMVWLTLRQWLRFEKRIEVELVGTVSHVAVHLFYFLFCDNYLACLFRDDEDTTKHYIYLICQWWLENEEELEFSEIHSELLKKIKNSHVLPKLFYEEEAKPENIAADLAQWCKITNEPFDPSMIDTEKAIKELRLNEDLADPEKFLEVLKRPSLEIESFEYN